MRAEIRTRLTALAEEGYRDFSAGLLPNLSKPMLGVRLPKLRRIAGELVREDWRSEVSSFEGAYRDIYFEETMLRAMTIGYGTQKKEVSAAEGISFLRMLIPHIDNWSVCDSFCNSFGLAARYPAQVWEALQEYLYSDREFEVRTGLVLLLAQYLKYGAGGEKRQRKTGLRPQDFADSPANAAQAVQNRMQYPYLEKILAVLNRPYTQGYYAQMAAAWTAAEAFVLFPYETHKMLTQDNQMDEWTYRRALQKICESRNPDAAVKQYIKALKKA